MNIFVFDIETIPDVGSGRRLYELDGLSDKDIASIMLHKRRQETGSEFLKLHLHRVVAISVVLRTRDRLSIWSLGDEAADEKELVERFYHEIEKYTPTIVSWNGKGFDLPVLHYRALLHGIQATRYWENGEQDQSFRWNNYLSRYHARHTDLMDILAGYEMRAAAPLDEVATMLGFPGKMGMSGVRVWDEYQAGNLKGIRDYCETDVANTYLVYLRFELMRGNLTPEEYQQECLLMRETLTTDDRKHLRDFESAWKDQ